MTTFQTELRFPNGSVSVCNYLKPYLNLIKERTMLIVICTNEIFDIVRVPMCMFRYKLTSSVEMLSYFFFKLSPFLAINGMILYICVFLL